MERKLVWALVLIALAVIVLLFNIREPATVHLIVTKIKAMSAFVYLGFIAYGVAVGVLLK